MLQIASIKAVINSDEFAVSAIAVFLTEPSILNPHIVKSEPTLIFTNPQS